MPSEILFRVRFFNQNKIYQVFVKDVYQGEMYGFVVLEDFVFDEHTTVVVDPSEEKLKTEFEGVKTTFIPMHAIIRIDIVEKRGTATVTDISGKVAQFPSPIYTPNNTDQ
ncbi:MAG: DUF1820 family protein [Gammaproteobacteria bacterium]|nr:DUF1820 family protein [Gammaproteobacteria bacterium]